MIEAIIFITLGLAINIYFIFFKRKKVEVRVKENTNIKYIYTEFELELILKINSYRTSIGLNSLELNDYISSLCSEHNSYMIEQSLPSHNNFTDRSQRIIDNLEATRVGENIAYNFLSSDKLIQAWLKSPRHKENLESPEWTVMGLSTLGKYTTNIFAKMV